MNEFVSEQLTPAGKAFDAAAMASGEPGLPEAFTWRGETYVIARCLGKWKETSAEGARAGGDVYLRRHCFELEMSDGKRWVVYFVRQTPRSGKPKARWFLYTMR